MSLFTPENSVIQRLSIIIIIIIIINTESIYQKKNLQSVHILIKIKSFTIPFSPEAGWLMQTTFSSYVSQSS